MRVALIYTLLAGCTLLLGPMITAAEDCSGHGTMIDGKCSCNNPWPKSGSEGWVGDDCGLPVYGSAVDGDDLTHWCRPGGCASLEPGNWSCFAARAPWNSTWNYFTVLVQRTSTDERGDPDLFGLWTDGNGSVVPSASGKGYDFQDTSSSSHPTILKGIKKADVGLGHDYAGAYLCVRAYGPTPIEFSLRATLTSCPASFDAVTAVPLMCQTAADAPEWERRFSECSAVGECMCSGQYAKPVPTVFPGIGFEDCSTPTVNISRDALALNRTFQLDHESVEPDKWRQYRFHVDEDDYEVAVTVALEGSSSEPGSIDLFLKSEQPAGWGPRQYDLRPRWNAATGDRTLEVVLEPTLSQWRTGVWFAGVVGSDAPINFTLTISKYECPGNCSSHGACVPTGVEPPLRHCLCNEGFGGRDCSKASRTLEYGQVVSHPPVAFEINYFSLLPPTEGMLSGNVELVVEALYEATVATHWLEAHPSVLLAETDGGAYPSSTNFTYKLSLDQPGISYNLSLCPTQVRTGNWTLAVYNPMPTIPVGYNLTVHRVGRCLHACSGHGNCSSDGVCECEPDWAGGDCSVSLNVTSCLAGSRRGIEKPDQHGTCWQECRCTGNSTGCSFADACADFTCQADFRRQASKDNCVRDECTKDDFHADSNVVCLRNCTCPTDGGPCALAPDCSIKIDIKGGSGGRKGVGSGTIFFWMVFSLLAGGAGALFFIHWHGIPPWLPMRERGYVGLYNEMSEHNGI